MQRENIENIEHVKKIAETQFNHFGETGEYKDDFVSFEVLGQTIINPFMDRTGRFEFSADEAYSEYGEANMNYFVRESMLRKI